MDSPEQNSDTEQSTAISIDRQEMIIRIMNQQSNASQLTMGDIRTEWFCDECELYIRSDCRNCPSCNRSCILEDDEMSFMIEFGLAVLQNPNLQMPPEEEAPTRALLSYKEYRDNVTAHRGTKHLRKTRNIDDICPVCCMDMKCGRLWHETRCGHFFHPMCLRNVCCRYGPRPSCPICRQNIASEPES